MVTPIKEKSPEFDAALNAYQEAVPVINELRSIFESYIQSNESQVGYIDDTGKYNNTYKRQGGSELITSFKKLENLFNSHFNKLDSCLKTMNKDDSEKIKSLRKNLNRDIDWISKQMVKPWKDRVTQHKWGNEKTPEFQEVKDRIFSSVDKNLKQLKGEATQVKDGIKASSRPLPPIPAAAKQAKVEHENVEHLKEEIEPIERFKPAAKERRPLPPTPVKQAASNKVETKSQGSTKLKEETKKSKSFDDHMYLIALDKMSKSSTLQNIKDSEVDRVLHHAELARAYNRTVSRANRGAEISEEDMELANEFLNTFAETARVNQEKEMRSIDKTEQPLHEGRKKLTPMKETEKPKSSQKPEPPSREGRKPLTTAETGKPTASQKPEPPPRNGPVKLTPKTTPAKAKPRAQVEPPKK